jgi:hypothetical protein
VHAYILASAIPSLNRETWDGPRPVKQVHWADDLQHFVVILSEAKGLTI